MIISPLAWFISDHALAAMFLPIGMLLYQNSLTREVPEDPELSKMLMIAIAMACNIGGPGAPSGGARNVIMMTYLTDMFGFDIGYFQWVTYCIPYVFVLIPLAWFLVNWRFKPRITSLAPLGMNSGLPLMAVSNGLKAILTNLMADGPAAAAVGPITLNMAGMVHPGTTYLPFMAMEPPFRLHWPTA